MRSAIPLILISCCALAAPAREEFKKDFAKTVTLTAGRPLRVEHQFGRVTVRTHTSNQLQVRATIRCSAPTAEQARREADNIQVEVDDGMIRTTYPRNNWPKNVSYATDLEITMPQTAPLDVRNRFGVTEIFGLHAAVTVGSGNGSVTLLTSRGRHRIENSFGPVEVRGNEGDVTINNANGDIRALDINGALEANTRFGSIRAANARSLTVRSSNANIEAENIGGPVNITNNFGRVLVTDAKGDAIVHNQNGEIVINGAAGNADLHSTFATIIASRVKGLTVRAQNAPVRADTVAESAVVETTFGNVDLRNVHGGARVTASNTSVRLTSIGGEVYAKSTFNRVEITDASGPITVDNQNGSVTAETKAGAGCKPVALRTTFGPIRVTIPRGAGYNLSARTTFGRIHTDSSISVAVSGDISPNSLTGKIGAGGCDLQLVGQNSSIDIASR